MDDGARGVVVFLIVLLAYGGMLFLAGMVAGRHHFLQTLKRLAPKVYDDVMGALRAMELRNQRVYDDYRAERDRADREPLTQDDIDHGRLTWKREWEARSQRSQRRKKGTV
jgi:hypothetical protein